MWFRCMVLSDTPLRPIHELSAPLRPRPKHSGSHIHSKIGNINIDKAGFGREQERRQSDQSADNEGNGRKKAKDVLDANEGRMHFVNPGQEL